MNNTDHRVPREIEQFLLLKKHLEDNSGFTPGDIVNQIFSHYKTNEDTIVTHKNIEVNKRFKVISVDENNIVIGALIRKNGTLGTHGVINNFYRLSLDPEYASALIVGQSDSFDVFHRMRESREAQEIVRNHNRARVIPHNYSCYLELLLSLNIGDELWFYYDGAIDRPSHATVTEVNEVDISTKEGINDAAAKYLGIRHITNQLKHSDKFRQIIAKLVAGRGSSASLTLYTAYQTKIRLSTEPLLTYGENT
jgi:hypothetical protein